MPLQNRVSPDGSLHTNQARGLFTGNRGIIHEPETKSLNGRRWSTNAWICCSLNWKGRKRDVWGRNYQKKSGEKVAGWSELFFLDEVTALAVGHRPCHTCRNKDAKRFHSAFCEANGECNAEAKNRLLHVQRWHSMKTEPVMIDSEMLPNLPDGVIVRSGAGFYAVKDDGVLPWDFNGYGRPVSQSSFLDQALYCVTPLAIVNTLREGYLPLWHSSAT